MLLIIKDLELEGDTFKQEGRYPYGMVHSPMDPTTASSLPARHCVLLDAFPVLDPASACHTAVPHNRALRTNKNLKKIIASSPAWCRRFHSVRVFFPYSG